MPAELRPNRTLGGVHSRFWELCERRQLYLQRCKRCEHLQWPPDEACEACDHDDFDWVEVSGEGKIISWCTFHQKYYKILEVPWDTILVQLREGPMFVSNPEGFSNNECELGMSVRVAFKECEDAAGPFQLPVFQRIAGT